jgi:hypothetical protein
MRIISVSFKNRFSILLLLIFLLPAGRLAAQKISFGVFADPAISWFSSNNIKDTKNDGSRPGFNFGLTFNKYFAENYAFSTGISLLNTGGRLYNTTPIVMEFNNLTVPVLADKKVVYKIQYVSIPIGLKFKSNQIGYITFFTDLGVDPKVVVGGKVDIDGAIKGEDAMNELNKFNMSYHILAGIEYSLGGSTAFVLGLGFENNFLDVTKDYNNPPNNQPIDKITQNILKFRIGVNF